MSNEAKADRIARACIRARHSTVWNQWTNTNDPELCEKCDSLIGEMFD